MENYFSLAIIAKKLGDSLLSNSSEAGQAEHEETYRFETPKEITR